jgi:NAD(P)-dependent dehydrogenase (short-subunit alcohol dehydrogenase family)
MSNKLTVIVGAGPGNGLAFGRRFHAEGHRVAMLARHADNLERLRQQLPDAHYFSCDVSEPEQIHGVFTRIRQQLGTIDTLIYNAGAGVFGNIEDITAEQFEAAWHVNALGCFCCVKEVLVDMRDAGDGNIIVIGATASLRGGAAFTAFSSAKGAQRNLVQSIARHLSPHGIHVAYIVIDGVIDMERTREYFPDKPDEFFLQPDDIAKTVFHLTRQPRSAWTFELDMRPFKENW